MLINYPQYKVLKNSHLLDLMYDLIILKDSPKRNLDEEQEEARFIEEISEKVKKEISKIERRFLLGCSSGQTEILEETLNLLPEEITALARFTWTAMVTGLFNYFFCCNRGTTCF